MIWARGSVRNHEVRDYPASNDSKDSKDCRSAVCRSRLDVSALGIARASPKELTWCARIAIHPDVSWQTFEARSTSTPLFTALKECWENGVIWELIDPWGFESHQCYGSGITRSRPGFVREAPETFLRIRQLRFPLKKWMSPRQIGRSRVASRSSPHIFLRLDMESTDARPSRHVARTLRMKNPLQRPFTVHV
jgi:hypothetical protein